MRLPEICIERPVLATVFSLLIVLFGLVSAPRLPNRELPNVDPPVVSVSTIYPGAAAEVVETSVTEPLEELLIGIEGIDHLTSVSREQVSSITVQFEISRDVDVAANDVRDRVARARSELPEDVEDPVVAKQDADANPVLWMALRGGRDEVELTHVAETQVRDFLSKLPGVASVFLAGERRMAMRVWIDNERLTSHQLTVADVAGALSRENVDLPSGRIEGAEREFTVRTLGELATAEAFEQLIVESEGREPIRLRDIGRVEVGPESERKLVRFDGLPGVGIGVVKLARANTIAVVDAVLAAAEELNAQLPKGIHLGVAFDRSEHIRESIRDVLKTLAEAVVLVLAVIYVFLRNLRATLIPAVAIPISVIGTFAVLYFAGYSINTLTLMGLTLAIGLVVDDAIIVLENIARWVEGGTPPMAAARRGMREISFAVLVATISVISVFLPLSFLTDTTGRLFREFGITVAAAVAISGFVALTLAPMLCARVLRPPKPERGVKAALARGFDALVAGYEWVLRPGLRHKGITLALGLLWFGVGVALLYSGLVRREFVPQSDRGSLRVFTRAPEGSTIEYTRRYQEQVESIVRAIPELESTLSVVALGINTPGLVNEGIVIGNLRDDRERSTGEIIAENFPAFWAVPGVEAWPSQPPSLGQSWTAAPVSVVLRGPEVEALARYADTVIARASREIPAIRSLRSDLVLNKPQLDVVIDRDRASDLGVSVRDIATTLQILLGGADLSTFKVEGQTYDVVVQLLRDERSRPGDIPRLYVRGMGERLIPLTSVVQVRGGGAPRGVPHYDRQRAATLGGYVAEDAPLGAILEGVREIALDVLPEDAGYSVAFSGQSEDFYDSSKALNFVYVLSVLVIYLVLAAQFESFLHPIIILTAVALSFTGSLVTLLLTQQSLNLFSQIGMVMLVGLVTKNAILIVEFANQLRGRGRSVYDAALEAARTRFRPILMTAFSTVVGLLPVALGGYRPVAELLGVGSGGELRAPLGIAVVGGMIFSTLFALFVVPATYVALEGLRARVAGRVGASATTEVSSAAAPF